MNHASKTFAYVTPKLYAYKSKLLSYNEFKALLESQEIDKIIEYLKSLGIEVRNGERNIEDEISNKLENHFLNQLRMLKMISPEKLKILIELVEQWLLFNKILMAIKKYESYKNIAVVEEMLPYFLFKKIKRGIETGIITLDSSAVGVLNVAKYLISKDFWLYLSKHIFIYEETKSFAVLQLLNTNHFIKSLMEYSQNLDAFERERFLSLVCPLLELQYVQSIINSFTALGSNKAVENYVQASDCCKLKGKVIVEAIKNENIKQLYESYFTSIYNIKLSRSEDIELQIMGSIRKLVRKKAVNQFGSYPFTINLGLSYIILLMLQNDDIMIAIMGKKLNADPKKIILASSF